MTNINDLLLLIHDLPNLFWYFATGFIFIKIYTHVSYHNNNVDIKHILLSSMVTSFVIKTIFDFCIGNSIDNDIIYSVFILIATTLLAYSLAVFSKSKMYDKVQTKLCINRTQTHNIWYDIFKKNVWVTVFLKDGYTTYLGQIEMLEENNREPIVVLSHYQLVNLKGEVVVDNSEKPNEKIMLNLKDFEQIELTEFQKSKKE